MSAQYADRFDSDEQTDSVLSWDDAAMTYAGVGVSVDNVAGPCLGSTAAREVPFVQMRRSAHGRRGSIASAAMSVGIVGSSIVLAGLFVNGYLAVAARALAPREYLYLAAFWSVALVAGFGVFLPIEQELARLMHLEGGDSSRLRDALTAAGVLAIAEIVVVLCLCIPLLAAFGREREILAALVVLCGVSAVQFVVRGLLIGQDRVRPYALLLLFDGFLRVGFALVVSQLGGTSGDFAFALVGAIACAHLPVLVRHLARARSDHDGPRPVAAGGGPGAPGVKAFLVSVVPLLIGSLAAQLLLNGLPIAVAATASSAQRGAAGQFQAAFQLARIPLFVAVPLQTTILPIIIRMLQADARRIGRILLSLVAMVVGLAALGVAIALTLGPYLLRLFFGSQYRVAGADLAVMALGVAAYLGILVVTQVMVAVGLHHRLAVSWLGGVAAAMVCFVVIPGLVVSAEVAFLVGSTVGFALGVAMLVQHRLGLAPAPRTMT